MTRERSLTIKLYRPVGLFELGLVWDAEMKRFPPRLAHQPIFYPVANVEYARQKGARLEYKRPKIRLLWFCHGVRHRFRISVPIRTVHGWFFSTPGVLDSSEGAGTIQQRNCRSHRNCAVE